LNAKNETGKIWIRTILILLLLLLAISITLLASVPPVSRDALTHHLAVPMLYIEHGGIYEIPHIRFSYYPMNLDYLYLIPLYFGNDIFPKYMHFAFALATALLMFRYLKPKLNTEYALFGALFFLSTPIIVKLSISVYVDLGLIFFSTASILYILMWLEKDFKLKYLIISAVCCGFALGTKYNGLIVFFLLTLFIPFIYLRSASSGKASQMKSFGYGVIFFTVALLFFSPWMIKNYIWTDNPLYPLYDGWFNPKIVKTAASASPGWNHFSIRRFVYKDSWWEIALTPIRVFFCGEDGKPKFFDGKLNPFLLLLPIFSFLNLRGFSSVVKTQKKILLAFSILFLLFVFFERDMRVRWISPIIPPLVLLSIFGLSNLSQLISEYGPVNLNKTRRLGMVAAAFFALLMNAIYIEEQFSKVDPFGYIVGRVDRDTYIEKYRPEYSAIVYANENLPSDVKIMALFLGDRGYYCRQDIFFGINQFERIVKSTISSNEMSMELVRMDVSHLLIGRSLMNKWVNARFNAVEKKKVKEFFENNMKLLFAKGGYGLYELKR
jgi:hypothetical protein